MTPEASGPGTLVFLQGTGGPDPAPAHTIREQLALEPGLAGYTVLHVAWAAEAAPDISVVPALPPRYRNPDPAPAPAFGEDPGADGRGLALAGMDLLGAAVPWPASSGAAGPADSGAAEPADPPGPGSPGSETAAAEEALLGSSLQRIALGLVTDAAVRRRVPLTDAASDFSRRIIFYLQQGAAARSVIANALRLVPQDAPVILFGHSLGGVAAVDLLTAPDWATAGIRVDLLVTAGSQSPWLYLLDGLAHLSPGRPGTVPVPWLNFWDERDLLAFCAEEVFAGRGAAVRDVELASGEPFPASHSAYFSDPALYRAISGELAAADSGRNGSGPDPGV